jgi:hypothetical protein
MAAQCAIDGGSAGVIPDLAVAQRDPVDRCSPMPAADSALRDRPEVAAGPGARRLCEGASRSQVARSCRIGRARSAATYVCALLFLRRICHLRQGDGTECPAGRPLTLDREGPDSRPHAAIGHATSATGRSVGGKSRTSGCLDGRMTTQQEAQRVVSASREIAAGPGRIFELIADPAQQPRREATTTWPGHPPGSASAARVTCSR